MKFKRKVIITFAAISVGIVTSFFMDIQKYDIFLNFMIYIIGGFFIGNIGEHISRRFRNGDN